MFNLSGLVQVQDKDPMTFTNFLDKFKTLRLFYKSPDVIDRVTRELSDLIARISAEALKEAQSANVVAANIQHIFAVTEQTSEGTRSTSRMVRELSRTAEELKASVARFKID